MQSIVSGKLQNQIAVGVETARSCMMARKSAGDRTQGDLAGDRSRSGSLFVRDGFEAVRLKGIQLLARGVRNRN